MFESGKRELYSAIVEDGHSKLKTSTREPDEGLLVATDANAREIAKEAVKEMNELIQLFDAERKTYHWSSLPSLKEASCRRSLGFLR